MGKFCSNCGNELAEDAKFCGGCGAAQTQQAQPQEAVNQQPAHETPVANQGKKNQKPLIIGAAAAAVTFFIAFILVIALLFSGGGYQKPIKNMIKGMEKKNYDTFVKAFPEETQEYFDELLERGNYTKSAFMKERLADLESEYGKNIKLSYKITDKTRIKDKDELERIENKYGLEDTPKAAYEVEVELTIKGSKDKDTEDMDLVVAKIGGKWYIVNMMGY